MKFDLDWRLNLEGKPLSNWSIQKICRSDNQKTAWMQAVCKARTALKEGDFEKAMPLYRSASSAAWTLLEKYGSESLSEYTRTNIEYLYTVRKTGDRFIAKKLALSFREQLMQAIAEFSAMDKLDHAFRPFRDMALASDRKIEYWVAILWAMEESQNAVIH